MARQPDHRPIERGAVEAHGLDFFDLGGLKPGVDPIAEGAFCVGPIGDAGAVAALDPPDLRLNRDWVPKLVKNFLAYSFVLYFIRQSRQ